MNSLPTRAVVTGASSGIGESFARVLAETKVNLVLVARRKDRLEKLAEELCSKYGITVDCIALDVTTPGAIKSLFEQATQNGKIVDLLINNAGAGLYKNFLDGDISKQLGLIQLNFTSLTEACHTFGRHMRAHGKPSYILNVASVVAYQASPRFGVYSATKFAVRILSRVMHAELRETNVSVSCLCPGGTRTEFLVQAGQTPNNRTTEKIFLMDSGKVARIGLQGTFARKPVIIPGILNKLVCFLGRLLPEGLAMTLAKYTMESVVSES